MGAAYYMTSAHYGKSLLYDIGPLREQLIILHSPIKGRAYYMT